MKIIPLVHYRGILFAAFLLCICSFNSYGQSKEEIKRLHELQQKTRVIYDSVSKSAELKQVRSEYRDIISHSKSFVAFTIGYELSGANMDAFNTELQGNGFPALKKKFGAVVFGYSRMNKRITGNLLFNVVGGNHSSNTGYRVSVRGAGASFDKGYAFISTDKIILGPFAGIGWQYHTIKLSDKVSPMPVTTLFDIAQGARSGKITQDRFHGIAGMQFAFNAAYRKVGNSGLQLCIRVAYNPVFAKSKYKYNDTNSEYKPEIGWRQYHFSILLNLFSRVYFQR